jgi:hypothetical protein
METIRVGNLRRDGEHVSVDVTEGERVVEVRLMRQGQAVERIRSANPVARSA